MVGSYLSAPSGERSATVHRGRCVDSRQGDSLVDKVTLDELDREGALAHTTAADNDELVLAQELGLRLGGWAGGVSRVVVLRLSWRALASSGEHPGERGGARALIQGRSCCSRGEGCTGRRMGTQQRATHLGHAGACWLGGDGCEPGAGQQQSASEARRQLSRLSRRLQGRALSHMLVYPHPAGAPSRSTLSPHSLSSSSSRAKNKGAVRPSRCSLAHAPSRCGGHLTGPHERSAGRFASLLLAHSSQSCGVNAARPARDAPTEANSMARSMDAAAAPETRPRDRVSYVACAELVVADRNGDDGSPWSLRVTVCGLQNRART